MTQPTLSAVRLIDPVLTQLAVSYRDNRFYWDTLAPVVRSEQRTGQYTIYDKEYWFARPEGGDRGPLAPYTRLGWGVSSASYECHEIGWEEQLSQVVAAASQLPEALLQTNIAHLANMIQLELEHRVAEASFNAATSVFGTNTANLGNSDKWDVATSDPVGKVKEVSRSIHQATGASVHTMVINPQTWDELSEHPTLINKFKYTSTSILGTSEVAQALGVPRIVVADTLRVNATLGSPADSVTAPATTYLYGKRAMFLASGNGGQVNPFSTFMWDERGNIPWAVDSYEEPQTRSSVQRVFTHLDVKLVSQAHTYLLGTVIS